MSMEELKKELASVADGMDAIREDMDIYISRLEAVAVRMMSKSMDDYTEIKFRIADFDTADRLIKDAVQIIRNISKK